MTTTVPCRNVMRYLTVMRIFSFLPKLLTVRRTDLPTLTVLWLTVALGGGGGYGFGLPCPPWSLPWPLLWPLLLGGGGFGLPPAAAGATRTAPAIMPAPAASRPTVR